jgi:hypothetical protein
MIGKVILCVTKFKFLFVYFKYKPINDMIIMPESFLHLIGHLLISFPNVNVQIRCIHLKVVLAMYRFTSVFIVTTIPCPFSTDLYHFSFILEAIHYFTFCLAQAIAMLFTLCYYFGIE